MKLLLALLLLIGGFGYYLINHMPEAEGDEARIDRMWDEMSTKGRF